MSPRRSAPPSRRASRGPLWSRRGVCPTRHAGVRSVANRYSISLVVMVPPRPVCPCHASANATARSRLPRTPLRSGRMPASSATTTLWAVAGIPLHANGYGGVCSAAPTATPPSQTVSNSASSPNLTCAQQRQLDRVPDRVAAIQRLRDVAELASRLVNSDFHDSSMITEYSSRPANYEPRACAFVRFLPACRAQTRTLAAKGGGVRRGSTDVGTRSADRSACSPRRARRRRRRARVRAGARRVSTPARRDHRAP